MKPLQQLEGVLIETVGKDKAREIKSLLVQYIESNKSK